MPGIGIWTNTKIYERNILSSSIQRLGDDEYYDWFDHDHRPPLRLVIGRCRFVPCDRPIPKLLMLCLLWFGLRLARCMLCRVWLVVCVFRLSVQAFALRKIKMKSQHRKRRLKFRTHHSLQLYSTMYRFDVKYLTIKILTGIIFNL